jgi:ABC-2 type transport system ATP-binding protein
MQAAPAKTGEEKIMAENIIEFEGVTKRYGDVLAVDKMSFRVQPGEILGFLGPNGSGKTTTMRLINGVIYPEQGSIKVAGFDTRKDGEAIRARSGVLTETASLYENLSVEENLKFFAELYGVQRNKIAARIGELLEQFHLTEKRKAKIGALSTGLKKRAAIAKALIHEPDLLFLDEPTSGLDPEAAREITEYIKLLRGSRSTVFVCTHNLPEAEHFCTRFVFLDRGRILESGTLEELEKKYVAEIELFVELAPEAAASLPEGYEVRSEGSGFVVKLPGKKSIPEFLRKASQSAELYGARVLNSNLEALYFDIRRTRQ